MIRVKSRTRLHDEADVKEAVADALAVADHFDLTPADRAALLPALLTILSQRHVELEQVEITGLGIPRPQG